MLAANQSLSLRLYRELGSDNNTGIVEVFDGISKWGGICGSREWSYKDAYVACRHLGFSSALVAFTKDPPRENYDYFINELSCNKERYRSFDSIEKCKFSIWRDGPVTRACSSKSVIAITCSGKKNPLPGSTPTLEVTRM